MDQRESIEPTIIKSERVNKPHDPKPTMDMQCDAIVDILTECNTTAYDIGYKLFGFEDSNSDLKPAKGMDNPSVYDKLAILRDRAYVLSDMLSTIKEGVSQ